MLISSKSFSVLFLLLLAQCYIPLIYSDAPEEVKKAITDSQFTRSDFNFLIVGGYTLNSNKMTQHSVSIRKSNYTQFFGDDHLCGGTILKPNLILTAAHCVVNPKTFLKRNANRFRVVSGAVSRIKQMNETKVHGIQKIIPHPKFKGLESRFDIALIILDQPMKMDGFRVETELIDKEPSTGRKCTAIGWGRIFRDGPRATEALYVDLQIMSSKDCEDKTETKPTGFFCLQNSEDKTKTTESGDSGSGLFCGDKLAGVSSTVEGEGEVVAVYTDVFYHKSWIKRNKATSFQVMQQILSLLITVHILVF